MCLCSRFDFSNVKPDRNAVKHFLAPRRTFLGVQRNRQADGGRDDNKRDGGVDDVGENGGHAFGSCFPFAYDQNLARRCAVVKQCLADGSKRILKPVLRVKKRLGHGLAAIGGLENGDCLWWRVEQVSDNARDCRGFWLYR